MPSAQLIIGQTAYNQPIISSDFDSVELNSGSSYTFPAGSNGKSLIVVALNDIYVAFSPTNPTPSAAQTPRMKISAGTYFGFYIRDGVSVTVLDA